MKKNKIKDILDLITLFSLFLSIIVFKVTDNMAICLISVIPVIIVTITDRIFWRCKKCGERLPVKSWFNKVICCPYCNANIDEI